MAPSVENLHIPHLDDILGSKRLIVDGNPFLMLAAELQNSSMTSATYMSNVWADLAAANINTVLGCVTWQSIEREEGKFDFAELDRIIADARGHGLKLVLLWFGSFKNGQSTYTPAWVKKNHKRFPRVKLRKAGGHLETADVLSIFHPEARQADEKAFTALMQHVKDMDENHSTVIMVQVENEVGVLGDSRDGNEAANTQFFKHVPEDLVNKLDHDWDILHPHLRAHLSKNQFKSRQASQSWEETFGKSPRTDELFMAYHYAHYVEHIAAAGKKVYPLPLYTNVWLNNSADLDNSSPQPVVAGGGGSPGEWPSGGAITHVLDIWQMFAPTLSFIAPDIYLNNYPHMCKAYRHRNQPLFIPEQRRDEYGARRIWEAFGSHQAIGTSPFGIDTVTVEENAFRKHYGLLSSVSQIILEAQQSPANMMGFYFDDLPSDGKDTSPARTAHFGEWELRIERSFVFGRPSAGSGILIRYANTNRFLLIGWGFQVTFRSQNPGSTFSGILSFEEKEVVDRETGELRTLRQLNGDETRGGKVAIMPSEAPDYGGFPISITIPARTAIADVEVYSLEEED